jgi:hypothetical protein
MKQGQNVRAFLPETMRLQGSFTWLQGHRTRAQQWWERSLQEAETMGLRYFAALTHLEMGQRLGDVEHLQKAEAIFAEVGALPYLEKVRALISAATER